MKNGNPTIFQIERVDPDEDNNIFILVKAYTRKQVIHHMKRMRIEYINIETVTVNPSTIDLETLAFNLVQ